MDHRGVYNASGAGAIMHAHPPYAIAAAKTAGEQGITPIHNEAMVGLKWIPVIGTSVAGEDTGEEVGAIAAQLRRWPALVIRGHGASDRRRHRRGSLPDGAARGGLQIDCIIKSRK